MQQRKQRVPYSRESLQQEQRRLQLVIKEQEAALRQRVQQLPGELLYAGVDAVLPVAITGKTSHAILSAARDFINKHLLKKTNGNTSTLVAMAKQAGLLTVLRIAWKAFYRRR